MDWSVKSFHEYFFQLDRKRGVQMAKKERAYNQHVPLPLFGALCH